MWYVNISEIVVVFNDGKSIIVISLQSANDIRISPGSQRKKATTLTEKYATTCHFRLSLDPGRWTATEYVCLVRPSGFEGLSFRLVGTGSTALGSEALRALIEFVS